MCPYREPGPIAPPPEHTASDDRTLSILMIAIGALRVGIAVATRETFGVEATIATLMIVLGLAGVIPGSSRT